MQLFFFFFLVFFFFDLDLPSSMSAASSGMSSSSSSPPVSFSRAAMEPTRVFMPVATTMPTQVPAFTWQEENAMQSAVSFSGWPGIGGFTIVFLDTSSGSPVRSISFTRKSLVWMLRTSAGTTSPVFSLTMSPGTISRDAISTSSPSRTTRDIGDWREVSASRASLALFSVKAAILALRSTMIRIAMESMYVRKFSGFSEAMALIVAEAITAPSSKYMTTEFSWMKKSIKSEIRGGCSSSLGPSMASSSVALPWLRPFSPLGFSSS
mmetsp:Transcript_25507/g.65670  ORF Transcript_25507/g.65670 Transcript_25507/m.65670 type:complete len:266 (-) Transcript_25507:333-1130(-)